MDETLESIQDRIKRMGYITVTPRKRPTPSFYELEDGTIISVMITINHILQDPNDPNMIGMNRETSILVFVDRKNRDPFGEKHARKRTRPVVNKSVPFRPLLEKFNTYDLSNYKILRLKTVVTRIRKTETYNDAGEAEYGVDTEPIIRFRDR